MPAGNLEAEDLRVDVAAVWQVEDLDKVGFNLLEVISNRIKFVDINLRVPFLTGQGVNQGFRAGMARAFSKLGTWLYQTISAPASTALRMVMAPMPLVQWE